VTVEATIEAILGAGTFTQRIQQIRLVPQRHGTEDHGTIYAAVARELYMPHLAPDFAYIHESPFYETEHFFAAYEVAARLTEGFTRVSEAELQAVLLECPRTLLVFRTLLGLTKDEFAHSTLLAGGPDELAPLTAAQIDTLERSAIDYQRLNTAAALAKATAQAQIAANGVPLRVFLHQRHYGGAFRQVLDATSTLRGDLIEDAVEALFTARSISFIRTGSHNQADIARRFEVHVTPAPDFVVYDPADDSLKAMLECKGTNNGGTARDKALRFRSLEAESVRLGGVPLIAVLGGIGWARINDALGPVVRDTDGRVFTLSTLASMLDVAPFPSLVTLP
jgi:hypothetical protein